MKSALPRHPRLLPAAAASVIAFIGLTLLASCGTRDDGMPSCRVSRNGAVEIVLDGVRPCVLYGSGDGRAVGADTNPGPASGSVKAEKKPGGTVKSPKAPAAKNPKAPAAPAPKVPAAPAPRPAAPAPRIR
ncbi:hypothetical protein [Streptomyces rimosus]|uniref:hypothetical protein n=1 Tax=Streptomyces rimosus TaxID=1927 RepID=UPI0004C28F28|nr:hypothetical protein [Streptomyces rimosus]